MKRAGGICRSNWRPGSPFVNEGSATQGLTIKRDSALFDLPTASFNVCVSAEGCLEIVQAELWEYMTQCIHR